MSFCPCFGSYESVSAVEESDVFLTPPSRMNLAGSWPKETATSIHSEFYRAISVAESRGCAMSEKRHQLVSNQKGFEDGATEQQAGVQLNSVLNPASSSSAKFNNISPTTLTSTPNNSIQYDSHDMVVYGSTDTPPEEQRLLATSSSVSTSSIVSYRAAGKISPRRGLAAEGTADVYTKLIHGE